MTPNYTFTVVATDSQGSYATATVVVTVLNANDNKPMLDLVVYNFTIPENSPGGKNNMHLLHRGGWRHFVLWVTLCDITLYSKKMTLGNQKIWGSAPGQVTVR